MQVLTQRPVLLPTYPGVLYSVRKLRVPGYLDVVPGATDGYTLAMATNLSVRSRPSPCLYSWGVLAFR